jgi:hypothetical protein
MPISAIAGLATRRVLALVLLMAFVLGISVPAMAGTTGVLSGTITSTGTRPVTHASITAVAPSGTYRATTDDKGFFSITGVQADTYTVSVVATGFDSATVTGVTISADQTTPLPVNLTQATKVIGRTASRSQASAFQPAATTDTYNLGASEIATQLGKKGSVSETSLLASLPGASLDSSGYPVLRGGRENEEGFQFEGIDYTDAFSNQFVNSLALNNPGGFQLTPGAGDASSGNSGTGVINLLLKRGTYPAFGSLEADVTQGQYTHEFTSEYGFATPNGRFSNYITFTGQNAFTQIGARGSDLIHLGGFFSQLYQTSRDLADVMTYKFGKDNNQKLEFVYQNQDVEFRDNAGGINNLFYPTNDPEGLNQIRAFTGLSVAQVQSLETLYFLQTSPTQPLNFLSGDIQPNETYKMQYSISPNSSTFLTMKYYQVNSVVMFDQPFIGATGELGLGDSAMILQGGKRTGFQFDGTKQLNDKNLLKFGAKYEFVQPVDSFHDGAAGLFDVSGDSFAPNPEVLDFLPGGYLAQNGFTGFRVPEFDQAPMTTRQDTAIYVDNTFTPTSKLNIDIGLRLDGTTYDYPNPNSPAGSLLFSPNNADGTFHMDSQFNKPKVWEPRLATSYQLTRRDAFRFAYSRSVLLPPIADVDETLNNKYYSSLPYANLAATAPVCGINNNLACANYGQQLFWENQAFDGIPLTPIKPETFSNFEGSYSHQFGGNVAMKVTPYYRRGFDALALASTVKTNAAGVPFTDPITGNFLFNPPVATNLGTEKTLGVEFYVTKDNPGPGFSGSFSANYINEFSNVVPLSGNEDFFPQIPAQSLALGNLYRVGFLSPFNMTAAVSYKTRSGWRFNPIVAYNIGYPINPGNLTSIFLGATPFNVVNTNVTSTSGNGTSTDNFVDNQNPGSVFNPNIAAKRGTPETAAAGGILSAPRATASMSFEFSPPSQGNKGGTYGLLVTNIFNQLYSRPALNGRYQPVATGIAGPQSGQSSAAQQFPLDGNTNQGPDRFANQPYAMSPSGTPRTLRFYYQLAF